MARSNIGARIRKAAVRIIEDNPDGIRFSDLLLQIREADSSFNRNHIVGILRDLDTREDTVEKPSRGLYRFVSTDPERQSIAVPVSSAIRENRFYAPFAAWLQNDVEDVTTAIPLGGKRFRDQWGTPDVIGIREPRKGDIIKAPIEIVSAEIKTSTNELIKAFGQACAYCLFSHRSYLVVPLNASADDKSRLDSLCQVFGIGFVLFDSKQPEDPRFEIRTRPKKQDPDLYYTNKYLRIIEPDLLG